LINRRYITLEELMKQVRAELLADLSASMGMLVMWGEPLMTEKPDTVFDSVKARKMWSHMEKLCHECGLEFSAKTAHRITELLKESDEIKGSQLKGLIDEAKQLQGRLYDEMGSFTYFTIERNKQEYLDENIISDAVANAFPSATEDMRKAGKCLAFDQWTASVFHCMRALEIGLQVLADDLKVPFERRNWENIINDIEAKIKDIDKGNAKADWKKKQFYSEVAVEFRYFKNAWRNHVVHARTTYDEEQAEKIFDHTKQFMAYLATELKELLF
jgi:hypothetical protein